MSAFAPCRRCAAGAAHVPPPYPEAEPGAVASRGGVRASSRRRPKKKAPRGRGANSPLRRSEDGNGREGISASGRIACMPDANFRKAAPQRPSAVPNALIGVLRRATPLHGWSNLYRSGQVLHRIGAPRGIVSMLGLVLCLTAVPSGLVDADDRIGASGWLQLERDQRTFRERAGPLDLREQRELSVIERRQRTDLRALDQRLDRAQRLDQRRDQRSDWPFGQGPEAGEAGTVTPPPALPRRPGAGAQGQRALERERLQRRLREYRQPFGMTR